MAPIAAPALTVLRPPVALVPVPLDQPPARVRAWFDEAAEAIIPDDDGTLATAHIAADAYARRAMAANTRRAYRAGARAWCAWCDRHDLPCLPARAADVVAFLAAERGRGLSVTAVELRRPAIHYLHFICGCAVPTAEAQVAETMAGMHRTAAEAGRLPARKLAATAEILRQILEPITPDLAGLRDRALLLLGFAGALRRAELAAIRVEHLAPCASLSLDKALLHSVWNSGAGPPGHADRPHHHFMTCAAWRPGRAGDPPRGLDQDRRPLRRQVLKRPDIRAMPGIGPRTTNWTVPVALAVQPAGPAWTFAL
jgi:Phage integrase, N-terminal SAM-like domain